MTYTDEQFTTLTQWEDVLSRAVRGAYLRSPGIEVLHSIHAIYTTATGSRLRFSGSCGLCARNILRLAGKAYLADKAEREEAAEAEDARKALRYLTEEAAHRVADIATASAEIESKKAGKYPDGGAVDPKSKKKASKAKKA